MIKNAIRTNSLSMVFSTLSLDHLRDIAQFQALVCLQPITPDPNTSLIPFFHFGSPFGFHWRNRSNKLRDVSESWPFSSLFLSVQETDNCPWNMLNRNYVIYSPKFDGLSGHAKNNARLLILG